VEEKGKGRGERGYGPLGELAGYTGKSQILPKSMMERKKKRESLG